MKPFLTWAGSKWKYREALFALTPWAWNTYLEPFLGSGALFIHLLNVGVGAHYVLADVNEELIITWRQVRADVEEVIRILEGWQRWGFQASFYYTLRDVNLANLSPAERAARFIYLNRAGFGGVWRVNAAGKFNVSFGSGWAITEEFAQNLRDLAQALVKYDVTFLHLDFEKTLVRAREGDFVFLDPPYDEAFDGYAGGFPTSEQERLWNVCRDLHVRGVRWMMTQQDTPLVRGLYAARWQEVGLPPLYYAPLRAKAAVARLRGGKVVRPDIIIINYAPERTFSLMANPLIE